MTDKILPTMTEHHSSYLNESGIDQPTWEISKIKSSVWCCNESPYLEAISRFHQIDLHREPLSFCDGPFCCKDLAKGEVKPDKEQRSIEW